ncbi:MAG TPA: N-acetylmuramic acid 6-phosphate etherase [Micropepsaceae bacterium]|nr:N-acetylmuramic acid 6-phosphate etherase [Micropepsaceae bacterium]
MVAIFALAADGTSHRALLHYVPWINAKIPESLPDRSLYVPGAAIETERPSPRYSAIDLWESSDVLDAMIEGQFAAVAAVRAARGAIEEAAHAMEVRLIDGGRLIYAGAGTSGRLAVQDGAELMPTFSWPSERLLLLIAGGNEALIHAVEGAEDQSEQALALIVAHKLAPNDVLLAAAASGTTPFTLACVRGARNAGALTVGIANNRDTPLLAESDCPIFLDTGVEPIAGSTRMKAGTAQRITLNLLSSLVMIRLGHVYEGLMVDVQATNKKLTQRSENMLTHLTGRSGKDVRDALIRADGSVKVAVLLLYGCRPEEAKALLERSGGHLRVALAELRKSRTSPE